MSEMSGASIQKPSRSTTTDRLHKELQLSHVHDVLLACPPPNDNAVSTQNSGNNEAPACSITRTLGPDRRFALRLRRTLSVPEKNQASQPTSRLTKEVVEP